MSHRRRLALAAAAAATVLSVVPQAAGAADDSAYADVASTPDTAGCTAAQAFAAGDTYFYAVKTRPDDTRSVLFRIRKDTGQTEVMTTGGASDNAWLRHANDMTMVDAGGKHYLFVVTLDKRKGKVQLVQLAYTGTTYEKVRSYFVTYKGKTLAASGISRVSTSGTTVRFFFKSAKQVYRGAVKLSSGSRTVTLSKAFQLSTVGATVEGAVVPDLSTFVNQGFHYDVATDAMYYPLTKDDRSVVLVYPGVAPGRTTNVKPSPTWSFAIRSTAWSRQFEIESIGVSGRRVYFNTNRASSTAAADAVHVLGTG
jgi:hypothetical protein